MWPLINRLLSLVEITAFRLESKSCKDFFEKMYFPPMRALKFITGRMICIAWLILKSYRRQPPLSYYYQPFGFTSTLMIGKTILVTTARQRKLTLKSLKEKIQQAVLKLQETLPAHCNSEKSHKFLNGKFPLH